MNVTSRIHQYCQKNTKGLKRRWQKLELDSYIPQGISAVRAFKIRASFKVNHTSTYYSES